MAIVNKLKVASGLKASYLALAVKDANTLYFCTDTKELFKGEVAYGKDTVIAITKTALEALTEYEVGITYVVLTDDNTEVYDVCHSLNGTTLASFRTNISKNITDVSGKVTVLEGQMTAVEGRATTLEGQMTAVEERATTLEGRVDTLEDNSFAGAEFANNTVSFKNAEGTVVGTINLPEEFFLDQNATTFVPEFAWSEEAYPASTNPNLDGEPVFVLGVKGDDSVTYSFVSMKALVPSAYTVGDTATVDLALENYEITATVKIDSSANNALKVTENGLMVDFGEVDFSGVTTRIEAVEGRATTLEGKVTTLEGQMTAVEGRATTLEGQMTAVEGRATTLEGRADSLEGRATTLEGQMTAVEGRATTLETEVSNIKTADEALAGRVTTLEGEMDTAQADILEIADAVTWGTF